jgi:hydrogenase maturation protease
VVSGSCLVLGLGNQVRSDDNVGLQVVRRLRKTGLPEGVTTEEAATAGLDVLDLIAGHAHLLIVDAIDCGAEPGTVMELSLADLDTTMPRHVTSSHDDSLVDALELGRRMALDLPERISIVAVQVADTATLSEECTPLVRRAIDEACRLIIELIGCTGGGGDDT